MNKLIKTILPAAALMALTAPSAFAASATWDGDTSAFWNNSANWSAAFPNGSLDIATFNSNSPNNTIDLGQNIQVRQIIFDTANVGAYTINGTATQLTFPSSGSLGITINSNVGAVTQTINARANILVGTTFTNSSTSASLNLAGGVNNNAATAQIASFTGAGNGGTVNGLSQTGGGALSATFSNSGGIFEITGTTTANGTLLISGAGGTRISSDVSSMTLGTVTGRVQLNNNLSGGGFNAAGGMTLGAGSLLEAFGANRTINTTTLTLNAAGFGGSENLTIGSLTTMAAASGAITNNIAAGKVLTFNNATFNLSDSATSRIRVIGGNGTTVISSNVVNGGGSAASGITKQGTGTLQLSGNNTYSGATQIDGGVLRLDSSSALGGGNLILNGGVLGLGAGDFTRVLGTTAGTFRFAAATNGGFAAYGADRIVNIGNASGTQIWGSTSNFVSAGNLVLGSADSTHKLTYQNGINLNNAARTIQVNNGSALVDGEISGNITSTVSANGSLTKTGTGTLALSGTNTYSGLTTVSAGTILINGSNSGAVQVDSGASLGGNGTVAGAVTIASGGTLAPGNSPGILNTGSLSLNGTFSVELNGATVGTQYDQVNVSGGVSLLSGNTISLTLGYTPVDGTNFFLINNDGSDVIVGLLNGYAQNDTFTVGLQGFRISYTGDFGSNAFTGGNDLVIQAIPEPSTWLLLSAALMTTLIFRRRRTA